MSNKLCSWTEYECQSYCEGLTKFCGSHNTELRKRDRQGLKNQSKKVYQIPKISPKQGKKNRLYSKQRETKLTENPICELRLQGCTLVATQVHHVEKRGINTNKYESFKSACQNCHYLVETKLSAAERREKGFLK